MTVYVETSILELNQENVTALAHYKPQVCEWETICPTTSRRFVPWVATYLLLESDTENVEDPPRPTEKELIVKASQEARFSKNNG